jgi:diguanylate cyclase (GGDEF)-like protein/PAS domain S-box-containing protein
MPPTPRPAVPREQAQPMSSFFLEQMDYIFFFSGLAFIGLGMVSYILAQEVNQRLPWMWLALFGFAHGLNEWLDLGALAWPDGVWFGALRWAVMTASFLFLVEFGRLSLTRRRGRGPGRWVLVILALGAGLGALSGWSGMNATTRYALGLVGSLGAGWAFLAEGSQGHPRRRPWLLAGGVGFILYGLATGLIVPRAEFFPAAQVNYETFTGLTGLPIQLLRGLQALWIVGMTVGYLQACWPGTSKGGHQDQARYLYGVGAALALILIFGWLLTQFLGNLGRQYLGEDSLFHSQMAVQRLAVELEQAEKAAKTISGSLWISQALESRSPQNLARANSALDRYQQGFRAEVAYLLDTSGVVIASSNRNAPDSFVGHQYAFRPYFQEAMAGMVGRYVALGVTWKKRGFYAANPVRDPNGKIIGAAVLKISLNRFQQDLRGFDPAFLIDPQGIVLVASRPHLDYYSLWPVTVTDPAGFQAQYGTDRFTPIFPQVISADDKVEFAGKPYLATRQSIGEIISPGWTLVNLEPFQPVAYLRLLGIATAFILVVLTLVFAGSNLSIRKGANRILASEARFRAVFEAAPEAVFVFDPETRKILDANPFMAQWLGYDPAELVNLEIDQVMEPKGPGVPEAPGGAGPVALADTPSRRYRRKDGALVDVELTSVQIFHEEHIRELVFIRDITERKQTEAELAWDARVNASMVELSRALMSSLPLDEIAWLVYEHALSLTDSKLAFCGYLNPQTGALVVPTLTGEVWEACQIKDKKAEFRQFGGLWGWVLKHAQPLLTNHPAEDPRSTGAPPGHLPIHRFLSVPAIIGDELVGLIALANADRDYTARDQEVCERLARLYALAIHRQRVDETLRESESGLKTILDNIQTGILIIDPETHVIVDANPEALRMIGVAKEQIVGSGCHQFVCSAEPGRCPVTDLHENVLNAEKEMLRPDGTSFWVIQTVLVVSLHGKMHLLESFVDISERKRSEEALSKNYQELQETMQQLEESRNMLQMVIESVPVRVFWKDRDLRYLGCNTLFARDAGFSHPEQLLGQDDFSMSWREQADLYRTDDRQVMESRCPKLNFVEPQTTSVSAKVWVKTSKVPLQMPNGEVFGVLGVYEDITERRQAEEAVQAANAKLQALVAQVEARNCTMTLANEMADMLQACQTSEEAYKTIGLFIPSFFPDDAGALYMLNNSRNLFEAVAGWGKDPPAPSVFALDECWAVRRGRLHQVENPQEALLCRHVTEAIPGGYLCVPLIAQGETLGVFHIRLGPQAEEQAAELEVAKEQLAQTVAEDMALALANLRLRETLRSQAIRDPLTGLFNRRYMEETLERELTRVKRQGASLGVIMLDLDHFKQYNDTYGHSAGDDLLSALGSLVKSQIREEDIACRYGGEEFLLILPGTSMEVSLERAEILRQAVQEMHLRYRSLKPITLSLGVAVYPDHGDTGLEIIQAADSALYQAKQAGRDRVMAADAAGELGRAQPPAPLVSLMEVG